MMTKDCIAMILAGGQGSRLGVLTKYNAKPAVQFGGKYRIVDFPLSNCVYSGIDTVGVLTQYQPLFLNSYIGTGRAWDLDRYGGGVYLLPPYKSAESGEWYKGTANAVYQNLSFLERFRPKNVLILSGDHIYKMHYGKMLEAHKRSGAAITISVMSVPWEEAGRFGIMSVSSDGRITEFEEKPENPKSNLASMGIYIFDYDILKKYLSSDERDPSSANDFGKNIIPAMLKNNERMYAWEFGDYWKDVGTVSSLWEANMDILDDPPKFAVRDNVWNICSAASPLPPHYIGQKARIVNSTVTEGCTVKGNVYHSVISAGARIEEGAKIYDSVIMSGVYIGRNAVIKKAVIGENARIEPGARIGEYRSDHNRFQSEYCSNDIVLIEGGAVIGKYSKIASGSMVEAGVKGGF